MPTAFDALLQAVRALDAAWENTATGGSAAYLQDDFLSDVYPDADSLNGGTVFITATTDGAAPRGDVRQIEDYTVSPPKLYANAGALPNFSASVGAGDLYAVVTNRWPLAQLLGKLNEWLAEQGDVPTEDTSLTTLAATREYTLPDAAKRDLRQVFIARSTSQPYAWTPLTAWQVLYAGAGDDGKLLLPYDPPVGYTLRLVYLAPHPAVSAGSDALSDYLALDLAGLETALRVARWRLNQPGDDDQKLKDKINDLLRMVELAKRRRRVVQPPVKQIYPYFPGD